MENETQNEHKMQLKATFKQDKLNIKQITKN